MRVASTMFKLASTFLLLLLEGTKQNHATAKKKIRFGSNAHAPEKKKLNSRACNVDDCDRNCKRDSRVDRILTNMRSMTGLRHAGSSAQHCAGIVRR